VAGRGDPLDVALGEPRGLLVQDLLAVEAIELGVGVEDLLQKLELGRGEGADLFVAGGMAQQVVEGDQVEVPVRAAPR
jgi:hypothetical protein